MEQDKFDKATELEWRGWVLVKRPDSAKLQWVRGAGNHDPLPNNGYIYAESVDEAWAWDARVGYD